jgi:Rrf2 family protein
LASNQRNWSVTMLRFTKAEEQALRLSMRLAETGQLQTLGELADQENLPEPTVAKLLGQLRRGGVVAALRGRNGGYELAEPPARTSVARVLKALGADPAPNHPCLEGEQGDLECPRTGDCGLRSVWRHLQSQVARLLEGTTLADLLLAEQKVGTHVNNLWPQEPQLESGTDMPARAGGVLVEGADSK